MSALTVNKVTKRYGANTAIDAVTLRFPPGVITAVIGPSGCGKTTLLELCNGLARPDSGDVVVFGERMNYDDLAPLRRRMGYAVQGTALFPHMTVRRNITLLAQLEGWAPHAIDARLDELLSLTHLDRSHPERYPHQLSGGQQQRVGLCRAMMLRPQVLLLDEPFAAIDPISREEIHHHMLQLHRAEPTTTVLVTHDMREALRLAEHLVIMREGRVIVDQSREALLARHDGTEPEALLHALLRGTDP